MKLIKQLSGYHLPHSGYIPVQQADPFADAPEGFREMMTKLGATSLDELDMEFKGDTITIHGGNEINLIVGKDFNVFYSEGGD